MSESVSAQFWFMIDKNTNKDSSSSTLKIGIHKQEFLFLQLIIWQEVEPLLAKI